MILNSLNEEELKFFVDSVRIFFKKTVQSEPEITSAFLGTVDIEGYEFNGIVTLSGSYDGQIIVSMPKQMLREILLLQQEVNLDDNNLLDIVGEIANTFAGNARKKLSHGDALTVSVPIKLQGTNKTKARVRKHPYMIVLSWNKYPALVCVDIEKNV